MVASAYKNTHKKKNDDEKLLGRNCALSVFSGIAKTPHIFFQLNLLFILLFFITKHSSKKNLRVHCCWNTASTIVFFLLYLVLSELLLLLNINKTRTSICWFIPYQQMIFYRDLQLICIQMVY